jgi:hypothetical protein
MTSEISCSDDNDFESERAVRVLTVLDEDLGDPKGLDSRVRGPGPFFAPVGRFGPR